MARDLAGVLLPRILVGGVITIALTILFSLPGGTVRADGSFDTTTDFFFCNQLPGDFSGPAPLPGNPSCMGDFSPGANPNFGFTWDMPSGDYNFSTFATFISGEFSIAADADIDDGTVVGGNKTTTTLGLGANICGGDPLLPQFILYDSTTDTSNTVDALPEGDRDRFSILAKDGGDAFTGQADADSPAVLKYPSFLNTLLDPDLDYPGDPSNGPLDPISPWARYTGLTQVSSEWIFFTILVFEKTQLEAFVNDPSNAVHPFARYGRNPDEAGWVHILILQDPSQLVSSPSAIGDFCTPMLTDIMLLGQVTDTTHGTVNRLTSPAANTGIDSEGTHPLLLYAMTLRDADGDGLENSFDTCPFAANLDDPRVTAGDDFDMIDPVCDPGPNTLENGGDFDDDGFENTQDNCPLVANDTQAQGEDATTYVQAAPDGGIKDDAIGDACDSEFGPGNGVDDDSDTRVDEDPANGVDDDLDGDTDEDGAGAAGNTPDESGLPLGSDDVADGAFLHDMNTDAVCIAANSATSDPDGDGWCGASPGADPAPNDPNITGAPNIDTDGDGYANDDELHMQTDPLVDCPLTPKPESDPAGPHNAWPSDMDNNGTANLLDLLPFKKAFNTEAAGGDDNEDGVASCADGIDNDSDGADTDDPDCHTDGDELNPASYDATRTEDGETTCYNGIDEAADGADLMDPNHCYKARMDLNPSGTGTANAVNLLDLLPFKEDFNVGC